MPIAPDPVDTIERFAELSALLNDPHALRAALLAGVGLDEKTWQAIEERWMERVRAPGGEALAQRLSERYAAMQRNLSESIPPTEPGGAPAAPPTPPSSTLRSPVPPAPIEGPHPLARTADTDVQPLQPALPFQPAPAGVAACSPSSPRPARSPLADTLDSPEGLPLRPALPFPPGLRGGDAMGQPAAKQGDEVVAVDTHIVMIPSPAGPVPTPVPMPFSGRLDGGLSADVMVEGQPAAVKGSTASNAPAHVPAGGPFQKPPSNKGTVSAGSGLVLINGKPAARCGDTALTCNDPADAPNGTIVAAGSVLVG